MNRIDLAQTVGSKLSSSKTRALITASGQYGLTTGGYQARTISLTELRELVVAPRTETERGAALR